MEQPEEKTPYTTPEELIQAAQRDFPGDFPELAKKDELRPSPEAQALIDNEFANASESERVLAQIYAVATEKLSEKVLTAELGVGDPVFQQKDEEELVLFLNKIMEAYENPTILNRQEEFPQALGTVNNFRDYLKLLSQAPEEHYGVTVWSNLASQLFSLSYGISMTRARLEEEQIETYERWNKLFHVLTHKKLVVSPGKGKLWNQMREELEKLKEESGKKFEEKLEWIKGVYGEIARFQTDNRLTALQADFSELVEEFGYPIPQGKMVKKVLVRDPSGKELEFSFLHHDRGLHIKLDQVREEQLEPDTTIAAPTFVSLYDNGTVVVSATRASHDVPLLKNFDNEKLSEFLEELRSGFLKILRGRDKTG